MGFWSSLRRRYAPDGGEPDETAPSEGLPSATPPPEQVEAPPAALPADVVRLATLGDVAGITETEALVLLRRLRTTPDEGVALDVLVERSKTRPLPEPLAVAVAAALRDRGDHASARALLETVRGASSLVHRADLLAEEGDLAAAIATVERAMLIDVDTPGARERRGAWRERLGLSGPEASADPATATVAAPRAKAPFDLVREVARGGAGVVFEARDRELGRTVALKVYHQPDRDRAQLLSEARVAAALAGPGVVRVFDVDPADGWLAIEWATLGALRDLLRGAPDGGEPLSLEPLASWVPRLAAALARVHQAGWVHHDVKPANILMSMGDDGRPTPWLADFGSARRAGEPSPPGSLGYVSPERIAGRASDPRDDVYGFGRVLEDLVARVAPRDDAWSKVAAACVGPDAQRPRDGDALQALLPRA